MSWRTFSLLIWTKLLLKLMRSLKTQKKHSRLGIKRLKNIFIRRCVTEVDMGPQDSWIKFNKYQ